MPPASDQILVNAGAMKAAYWFFQNGLDVFLGIQGDTLGKTNDTWTTLTGWREDESSGQSYWRFFHQDDIEATKATLRSGALGERTVCEHRLRAKSGEWLWVRSYAARGEDDWVLIILRDITEERRREQDAEEARQATGMLSSTAGVAVWRYNPDTDVYEINPDFSKPAVASGPRRRSGQNVRRTVHRADAPALHLAWERTLATGEAQRMDYREMADDGSWRRKRSAFQGGRLLPSGRWEAIGIIQDVTELTAARDAALSGEQAARSAAEAKSQFLANMSHEIRTPMNGVLGILHLLKSDPPAGERQRLVEEALSAGANLSDLLNDIIDYADIESGRLVLAREAIDPAVELGKVVALLRPRAEAKGLKLEVTTPAGLEAVRADPGRLRQMFLHLIGNAVKFTQAGSVKATLTESGVGDARRLRLEVEDTGVGIPADVQAGLFERFRQGDNSMTRSFGGQGLGLTITRRLAELMDGVVGFRSEQGVGSTFWVEIAAPACAASAEPEDADSAWLSGLRVLVVEDNPTNRMVACSMLRQLGAQVDTAEDGALGVAAVEQTDFDLIFMDIQMPVMDGVEATRRIRAMGGLKGHVPIVATTANVMPAQLVTYRQCGINGVVAKPISPSALLAEVSRVANDVEPDAEAQQAV